MTSMQSRIRGALFGLAIGDALGWPAMFHRSHLYPFWTRRLRREIDAGSEESHVIRPPMPFALNQPVEGFALSPTDDTEWAAFTAEYLLRSNGELTLAAMTKAWLALADTETVRGGISTQAALANLRRGLEPPVTGHDNPHYFDDGACPRAVVIGTFCAGSPDRAARVAALDASVTNAYDGLWAAEAVSRAVALLCAGEDVDRAIHQGLTSLPDGSWIGRLVLKALEIAGRRSIMEVLPELIDGIVNREYSYGSAAPETLALALTIVKSTGGNFSESVLAATAVAKTADSVPALVGALCGAANPDEIPMASWKPRIRTLQGICIPELAGRDYLELVNAIAEQAPEGNGGKE